MSKGQKKIIKQKNNVAQAKAVPKSKKNKKNSILPWVLGAIAITALCLFPMVNNGFTNWDDEYYVINNALLRGPDWKGIFTQPVAEYLPPILFNLDYLK